jgi:hypothetical protein
VATAGTIVPEHARRPCAGGAVEGRVESDGGGGGDGGGHETATARARDPQNEHPRCSFCGSRAFGSKGRRWKWWGWPVEAGDSSEGGWAPCARTVLRRWGERTGCVT